MFRKIVLPVVLGVAAMLAVPFAAQATPGVKAGMLRCDMVSRNGFLLGSDHSLACTYTPASKSAPEEKYRGVISDFGIDLGEVNRSKMAWAVFAPAAPVEHDALSGNYFGGTANITLGVGGGVDVLVGGLRHSFALQPIAVQGSTGADISAGIRKLHLEAVN